MIGPERTIVIVEDEPGHIRLFEKNIRRAGLKNPLVALSNGRIALDYLHCRAEYAGQSLPHPMVIILDLNMPIMTGLQVLKEISQFPDLNKIPRIILTTSDDDSDLKLCEQYGYTRYLVKPPDYGTLVEIIRGLDAAPLAST